MLSTSGSLECLKLTLEKLSVSNPNKVQGRCLNAGPCGTAAAEAPGEAGRIVGPSQRFRAPVQQRRYKLMSTMQQPIKAHQPLQDPSNLRIPEKSFEGLSPHRRPERLAHFSVSTQKLNGVVEGV